MNVDQNVDQPTGRASRTWPWILLAVLLLTGAFAFVGLLMASGGSASARLASGRAVEVEADSLWLALDNTRDVSTITAGRTEIVVEPGRILIDGAEVVQIPEATGRVKVTRKRGAVKVVADGRVVYDAVPR